MSRKKAWMLPVGLLLGLLLVVGTLVCGGKLSPEEKAAIAAIQELGGSVRYKERIWGWGGPLVGVSFFGRPAEVTDADLIHLKGLTNLYALYLTHTEVTDTGLEHLKGMTSLGNLGLSETQVTDAGLERLKGLTNFYALHLTDTEVTDAGLEHLKGLTKLERLDLSGTQVTDAGVNELKKALPRLRPWLGFGL